MPIKQIKQYDDVRIGIWQITEDEEQLLSLLDNPASYREELDTIVSGKRRIEFLAVRVLLSELSGQELRIAYELSGRPYLVGTALHIGISHTKGYAAVILSDKRSVAIDIEQRAPKVMRLKEKFLNDDELLHTDSDDPLSYTLICWSAKESMFKIIPDEEIDFKQHLLLDPFRVDSEGEFLCREQRTVGQKSYKMHYENTPPYVLTWLCD